MLLFPVLRLFSVLLRVCLVYKKSFPQSPPTDASPEGGFGRCFVYMFDTLTLVAYYFKLLKLHVLLDECL